MLKSLTIYHVLALAVGCFLVDHIGAYFFTGNEWFRVLRASVLVWFFPIGYFAGKRSGREVWAGALALIAINLALGFDILPLNILCTMLITRAVLPKMASLMVRNIPAFLLINFALVVLYPWTYKVTEYGTLGLMIALAGYFCRQQDGCVINHRFYFAFVSLIFVGLQQLIFNFSPFAFLFFAVTTGMTGVVLLQFENLLRRVLAVERRSFLHLIGHKTLEVYVVSFAVIKLVLFYTQGHGG